MRSRAEPELPTLLDLLRLPRRILERAHHPDVRLHTTGHTVPIPPRWMPSIGNWARRDWLEPPPAGELPLFDFSDPSRAHVKVSFSTFRQWKWRYKLQSLRDFATVFGHDPWKLPEACYRAHHRVQAEAAHDSGVHLTIGEACYRAWALQAAPDCPPHLRVGVMPIEYVCYTRLFQDMLDFNALSYDAWHALDSQDKALLWDVGNELGEPWEIKGYFHVSAIYALPAFDLSGAGRGDAAEVAPQHLSA